MNPNVLDKKINYDYLEKDVGLKRFFPDIVLQQKAKNLKKMIIKGMKIYENLNEIDCMLKYLDKLYSLWKYNEETYKCHLGTTWMVPITVTISLNGGISCKDNSQEAFQITKFDQILLISTESDENKLDGLLKLKIIEAKELLIFKVDNLRIAENMASLIDGYCSLVNKSLNSIWINPTKANQTNEKVISSPEIGTPKKIYETKKSLNIVQIINENDETNNSLSNIENNGITNLKEVYANQFSCNKIPIESLNFHEKLGSGQFGDVFKGSYKKNGTQIVEVAIKKLKLNDSNSGLDSSEQNIITQKFIREAKIMENFDHPHIIKLIGVCLDDSMLIVMELAKFGQLARYLQSNKDHIETVTLLLYCYQLSTAMTYLESKKFVHRDIAARNILVVNHECIKLADFGLSREVDENVYMASKTKLPIKWMAPESINFRKFTSLSDVWMFGICMWEILSYGSKPFQGIKNPDVIKLIEDKQRLERPPNCPEDLYRLFLQCWEYDSSMRPSFTQLKDALYAIYTNYRDKGVSLPLPQSSSNGSSFLSNSSISSTLSAANSINPTESNAISTSTMTIMMMSLSKNGNSPKSSPITVPIEQSSNSPPPKPTRSNKFGEYSPTHASAIQKRNYPLKLAPVSTDTEKAYANNGNNNVIILNRKEIDANISEHNLDNYSFSSNQKSKQYSPSKHSFSPTFSSYSTNQLKSMESSSSYKFKLLTKNSSNSELATTSSKLNDYIWLDEKLKAMGIDKTDYNNEFYNQRNESSVSTSASASASTSISSFNSDINKKDLILRDQTLKFIQTISVFIKYLNTENYKVDSELRDIMISLKNLIETIESIELYNQSKKINEHVNELERCLNLMIKELKQNRLENVINAALDLARTANDLFLTITKPNNSLPVSNNSNNININSTGTII